VENGWKVYDIVIEGVSLVTNYRSQFSNEIRQNGIDSLNKKLAEKNKATGA
jgi:phospholipid transport system substrate-binding protein